MNTSDVLLLLGFCCQSQQLLSMRNISYTLQKFTPSKQDHPGQIIPSFLIHPYDSLLNNNICSSAVKSSRPRDRAQWSLWVGAGEEGGPGRVTHTLKNTQLFSRQCPLFHFQFCFLLHFFNDSFKHGATQRLLFIRVFTLHYMRNTSYNQHKSRPCKA